MNTDLCTDELRRKIDALQDMINECERMCNDIMSENEPDIDKISSQATSDNFNKIYALFESLSLKGDSNTIKLLCQQGLSEVKDEDGDTCLLRGSIAGNLNLVQSLIECGCNKDAIDNNGDNALILASTYGETDIESYLISVGFDKDWENQQSDLI